MKRSFAILLILAYLFLALGATREARAQAVNATLLGTVTDTSGATVDGAKVTATETKTSVGRSTTTNPSGNYEFPNLPPGIYEVVVEQQGFKSARRTGIEVQVNSDVRVNLILEAGSVTEVMQVTADTPILQTDRSDVGSKMEARQVADLPLGTNRNFQNLLNLVPGTTRAHRVHSEFFNSQDSLSTEVNGQFRLFSTVTVEGVDDNERTGLLQIYVPPAEAIQTVDVVTSNYSAEFGRAGGAITNVILKSGTNSFHGSAYEFNRVSAMAARSFFNPPPGPFPPTTYNYYGGTIGGPIIKNKLFFFGDILRISDLRGIFNLFTVPTDDFRNGNFNAVKSLPACQTKPADCNIYDPATGNPDGTGRIPFAFNGQQNVIDPARFANNQIVQRILALVPHANLPGITNNYQSSTRFRKNTNAFDGKIDYNPNDKDRIAFRVSRAVNTTFDQPTFGLAGGPRNGGFLGTGVQHTQSGAINFTHVFGPSLIVETRLGLSHYRNVAQAADYGSKASDALGVRGVNLDAFTSGLTSVRMIGINNDNPLIGYSASLPWDRGETNISAVNIWTKIHGNHAVKWGLDIRRLRDDLVQSQNFGPRGRFDFGTGTTSLNPGIDPVTKKALPSIRTTLANNYAAFLLDAPTQVGRDVSVTSGSWRETELFTFVQDQWRVGPKLTVDAGVRWELYLPATANRPGRYSNYNPTDNTLVIAGIGGNPANLGRETYYHYFAPRLGLAYRLTEKTVFRSGFGISYEPFPNNAYAFNFPVRQNNAFNQDNAFGPARLTKGGPVANLNVGFPPPAPTLVPDNGIVIPRPNEDYFVVDQKFKQPYVESWNLAIQQALPYKFVLDVAYVGNHGVKVPMSYDLNAAIAPAAQDTCPVRPLCSGGVTAGRTAATNFLYRPSSSNYHALQVKFDHRMAAGLLLTTSYTWSKAMAFRSDAGDGGGNDGGAPSYYVDFHRNYMIVSFSRAHTFVQSFVYELPFGKNHAFLKSGPASWILGGWQVSGILTAMGGRPLEFNANGNSLNAPGNRQTPDQVGAFRVLGGIGPASGVGAGPAWFDTAAFTDVKTPGVFGNVPRYAFRGPKFFNLDTALFKKFSFTERVGLELRAEAFSVTNTPQFDLPNGDFSSSNFGHITSVVGGNRVMELGAKITF